MTSFIPLGSDEVQELAERTGLPLTSASRVDSPAGRGYGYTDTPINAGGVYLIDLASGDVLEEVMNPPWVCSRCNEIHPRVDPCVIGRKQGRNQYS